MSSKIQLELSKGIALRHTAYAAADSIQKATLYPSHVFKFNGNLKTNNRLIVHDDLNILQMWDLQYARNWRCQIERLFTQIQNEIIEQGDK